MTNIREQLGAAHVLALAEENLNAILKKAETLGFHTALLKHAIKAYAEAYAVSTAETAFFNMSRTLDETRNDARERTKWLEETIKGEENVD